MPPPPNFPTYLKFSFLFNSPDLNVLSASCWNSAQKQLIVVNQGRTEQKQLHSLHVFLFFYAFLFKME